MKHAVTVLLTPDETVDDQLRVFQTFGDCVCRLVSETCEGGSYARHTDSFLRLRAV